MRKTWRADGIILVGPQRPVALKENSPAKLHPICLRSDQFMMDELWTESDLMIRLSEYALDRMLRSTLRDGALHVVMPSGDSHRYGDQSRHPVTVRLRDASTVRRLALNPEMALGEAYMNGSLTIDGDDLQGFLSLIVRNARLAAGNRVWWQKPLLRLRSSLRVLAQNNVIERARGNVAHHYDLSGRLYDLFLDEDRQYSCGYFKTQNETLEQAQACKKKHIARKLMIEPGMSVLDIGCGWGGMALTLAKDYDARVVGITLSQEQHAYATRRAEREGLAHRVDFRLCDYRHVNQSFDRIVSIGMFEHVGLRHFDEYFQTVRDRLLPDGIALIHTIGWAGPAEGTNPWIAKYIFPGDYIPTVSEAMSAVEKARLWATDIECWRLHYAYTLRHWYNRFQKNEDQVAAMYDDRFVRMWRFYLAACEQTFRNGPQAVFQFQLSRYIDAVPPTRDYIYDRSGFAAITQADGAGRPTHYAGNGRAVRPNDLGNSHYFPRKEQDNDRQNPSGRRWVSERTKGR
ncbi:cyclopropane-fatty-acyl-phospholipid synthase family protein [Aliiroseovarius sp. S1339]|uniref:SAM-dependent methyltransferase n=1 Tax=Aliiroseovarius sp. S1339 TaxID=2936990 RepID=UPI0020BFF8D4|nr:cyclopropane-fatty-acyl-phospholipid synthase family protein [Aliiroseovarius sp. S1339]MCK8462435.1 cyclopropane-fatty-acyl-phospholipid synthase family protein [Aliiroseovarius sp. S1339]